MRRYGSWAGDPDGKKECPDRCIAEVAEGRSALFYQCQKPRGKGPDGLYCGVHARQLALGRTVYVPKDK